MQKTLLAVSTVLFMGNSFAQNFCEKLNQNISKYNNSNSIIIPVTYNYSVFNRPNFTNTFEFKYEIEENLNYENNHYEYSEDDLNSDNYGTFTNNMNSNSLKLKNCNNDYYSASFKIRMVDPGLFIQNNSFESKQPEFVIKFRNYYGTWQVAEVSSENFKSLYYNHLFNSFKAKEKRKLFK